MNILNAAITASLTSFNYEGWTISEDKLNEKCVAEKVLVVGEAPCKIELAANKKIAYEGYWPQCPETLPSVVITGSCIYSDCWRIQFEAYAPGEKAPRPFILGLAHDRERICHHITHNRKISHIDVPIQTCEYQDILLAWQVSCAAETPDIEKLIYHLPISIYHNFINEIETALEKQLPILHTMLDEYGCMLKKKVASAFMDVGIAVEFCDPNKGPNGEILDAHAADQAPYLDALQFDNVLAIEDLAQLSISALVAKKTGITIPCRIGVLGLPHPISECCGQHCNRERLNFGYTLSGRPYLRIKGEHRHPAK